MIEIMFSDEYVVMEEIGSKRCFKMFESHEIHF